MADAAESASPAPAVAMQSRSETPQNEPSNADGTPAPTSKNEETLQKPVSVPPKSMETSANDSSDVPYEPTVADPSSSNPEPQEIPDTAAPARQTPPVITTSAAGTSSVTTIPAVAPPASTVPAPTPPPHVPTPAPTYAPESSTPAKRSRTPELGEDTGADKRRKIEHPADQDGTQTTAEVKLENDVFLNGDGESDWNLESMLANALGAVNEADDSVNIDTTTTAAPTRRRLEKMKFIESPTYFSRSMGLPLLGSLAVQILLALFQQPSEVTDKIIRDSRTEGGKVYVALRGTFMASLKLFTDSTAFLNADDLDIHDPGDRETIQMANLANMCASFYGPGGPTMATAHDYFLKIMIPENGMITEEISSLYLDQKTQSFLAYANVMEDKESTRNSLMDKFFPLDLEDKLRAYWRESNLNLTISADQFVRPFTDRRNLLRAIGHDKEKRRQLEAKYQFATFLDSLSAFIRSNFEAIVEYAESHGIEIPNEAAEEEALLLEGVAPPSTYSGSFPGQQRRPNGTDSNGYEITGLASLIAEKLSSVDGFGYGQSATGLSDGAHLPPTQSLPTSVLYERARQAAVAKSSTHAARREGLHSTRRPWTPEEEKALMEGLDKVKGPHWSQILQLYGQNGTISDILKDRTQVQLKDKARNLKLFFLKTNSEMPYYLQCVTGELKTRAPGQAARKEAEEQARQGVMNPNGSVHSSYAPNYTNGTTNGTYTVSGNTSGLLHAFASWTGFNDITPSVTVAGHYYSTNIRSSTSFTASSNCHAYSVGRACSSSDHNAEFRAKHYARASNTYCITFNAYCSVSRGFPADSCPETYNVPNGASRAAQANACSNFRPSASSNTSTNGSKHTDKCWGRQDGRG
ncbi:Telomeric DNA-binding factor trf1 [Cytospora mali]|uniref:Telomeric DNA-binding factor trf1 n=1 Tax=Cytospora mali TaxID=578113 RepID=A0A194VVI8_CYTMA|nr:Telomeric DNA-binding factor trf1 [Valsa mali]